MEVFVLRAPGVDAGETFVVERKIHKINIVISRYATLGIVIELMGAHVDIGAVPMRRVTGTGRPIPCKIEQAATHQARIV